MKTSPSKAETKFTEINGNKIAYRVFGQGKYLLFYNRFRGILDTWDPFFLDTLAKKNTVVLFDYPGVGDSEGVLYTDIYEVANTGIKLMDYLKFDTFNVVGWSYGGLVAQAALFLNKSRVLKAVLIGTNPVGNNEVPFEKSFFERALKPVKDLEDEYVLFFEPASEKSKAAAKASHNRIAERLDRNKIPATQEEFQRYFGGSAMIKEDKDHFCEQYKTLQNEVLIISGDHDISFAVENWFPLLKNAPSAQHIILNDAGHGPQHQEPDLMAGDINLFLNTKNETF